jgi:hypothetical protein
MTENNTAPKPGQDAPPPATRTEAMYFAFAGGMAVWSLICAFTGTSEAWDSNWYVYIGLPLLTLAAGVLGYYFPAKAYRHGLWLGLGQFAAMLVIGLMRGKDFNLFPLTLALCYLLSLPLQFTAIVTSFFGLRKQKGAPEQA